MGFTSASLWLKTSMVAADTADEGSEFHKMYNMFVSTEQIHQQQLWKKILLKYPDSMLKQITYTYLIVIKAV